MRWRRGVEGRSTSDELGSYGITFPHGAVGHWVDPSWSNHWSISRSGQCSMFG